MCLCIYLSIKVWPSVTVGSTVHFSTTYASLWVHGTNSRQASDNSPSRACHKVWLFFEPHTACKASTPASSGTSEFPLLSDSKVRFQLYRYGYGNLCSNSINCTLVWLYIKKKVSVTTCCFLICFCINGIMHDYFLLLSPCCFCIHVHASGIPPQVHFEGHFPKLSLFFQQWR